MNSLQGSIGAVREAAVADAEDDDEAEGMAVVVGVTVVR
jgi:hypothetical protein